MKAFLVLPFLFLLFSSSQESALSRKRSNRGLNTTLQTNFNGTFHRKNPCTNADVETSSYIATHEFHHHIKEDNWSDYMRKCSAIINNFLRGVGNLVRLNRKENSAFNFHVNTSISQKQDAGHCDPLPTIVIEAESCELLPSCKKCPKAQQNYLSKDARQSSKKVPENYFTTPPCPTEDTAAKRVSNQNIAPLFGLSTPSAQETEAVTDFSQNQPTTCDEFPGTSGRDFAASVTILPERKFTTPVGPTSRQEYFEGGLFTTPETRRYPYSTPTISEYETTFKPSVNDGKIVNNQYRAPWVDQKPALGDLGEEIPDQTLYRTSPKDFSVQKPIKNQQNTPLGLGEPDYVEEMIPPTERFQPADFKTTPNPQMLDKFPLKQQNQPTDDMYINNTPFVDQQNGDIPPQGSSSVYPNEPDTFYPTTPSPDCLTTLPPNQISRSSTPVNDFQPSFNTPVSKQPFIPLEKFPVELPTTTPDYPEQPSSYPDVYTGRKETTDDFYTPVFPESGQSQKIPPFVNNVDNIRTTVPPRESFTTYDSDEDVPNNGPASPDEEFYIKNQLPSQSPMGPFVPPFSKQSSKAQPEIESLTTFQPPVTYPEREFNPKIEEPRFSQAPERAFEPITDPIPPVTYPRGDFYPSRYPNALGNGPSSPSELNTYAVASSQASSFSNFENPEQQPRTTPEPINYSESQASAAVFENQNEQPFFSPKPIEPTFIESNSRAPSEKFESFTTPLPPVNFPKNDFSDYPSSLENPSSSTFGPPAYAEASSQASAVVEEPNYPNFENPDQYPRRVAEPIRTSPRPPVNFPENDFSDYPAKIENPSSSTFGPPAYSEVSSQASAVVEEPNYPNFENPDQYPRHAVEPIRTSPRPPVTNPENNFYPSDYPSSLENPSFSTFGPPAYSEASSQASAVVDEPNYSNFENPDQYPRRVDEPIKTSPRPPVNFPKNDFSDYPSSLENPSSSTFGPPAYSEASSQASAVVEEPNYPNFENPDQYPSFETTTTPPPPVTYPEDLYSSDYPSTSGNSPSSAFEPLAYSQASSQASARNQEPGFYNLENPDQYPTEIFEPTTTPSPPVAYPEDNFYSSDYPSSLGNSPSSAFQPIANSQASSQATSQASDGSSQASSQTTTKSTTKISTDVSSKDPTEAKIKISKKVSSKASSQASSEGFPQAASQPFSQASSQATAEATAEATTEITAKVSPQDPSKAKIKISTEVASDASSQASSVGSSPASSQATAQATAQVLPGVSSQASSQASAGVQEPGFENFENPDHQSRGIFEPTTTLRPITYPQNDFYPSDYPSSLENPPTFREPEAQTERFEPNTYATASSQASAGVLEPGFMNFENPDQQPREIFEPTTTPRPPVTYPEDDFYTSDYPSNLENTPSSEVVEPFRTSPRPPVTYPENNFYPSDYPSNLENSPSSNFEPIAYSQASAEAVAEAAPSSETSFKPEFQPTEKQGFPVFRNPNQQQAPTFEPIAYSGASSQAFARTNNFDNSKPAFDQSMTPTSEDYPTDFIPTTQSPESLSFSAAQADAQSESIIPNDYNRPAPTDLPPFWTQRPNSQSDLQTLDQKTTPQSPDYYNEEIPDRNSQQSLVPLDTTTTPQPQPEEISTPPSYQDYTPGEKSFIGDSTPPAIKSRENIPVYSPPFEPEPQPQPQPPYYIPGDNILPSTTFENTKTTDQYPVTSFQNLDTQEQSSFRTTVGYTQPSDFVTTPTPFADIPSFQTPPRSKPEEIITNSEQNIGAQETLLFGDNVSPQPQPTTAVKSNKEIATTEYQTSPAPNAQPQTTMNYPDQHSDGKIPDFFTNQQQLVTSEPDFDYSTSAAASEAFSQPNPENHQQTTEYPLEEAPQPPLNYPKPNSFLPYNNQLRSQPIYRQPHPTQQEFPMNSSPDSSQNPSRIPSRMQPYNDMWMSRSNEQYRPRTNPQVPQERFFNPEPNYNSRERSFPRRNEFAPSNEQNGKIGGGRFKPTDNYPNELNRNYEPRTYPQRPQQAEPFYEGFPSNVSYPDYGQRPKNGRPFPGQDYPEYDQVFPNPRPRQQFAQDKIIPSDSRRRFDGRGVNHYYPQRPVNYPSDREQSERLFEEQQHTHPLFDTLENQMQIPLHEPSSSDMPNESSLSERNYFRDNSPGWERSNPQSPQPESQLVSDLTDPSNNPDRSTHGRFNYMDRPLRKPFNEDRMRPVSTPERF